MTGEPKGIARYKDCKHKEIEMVEYRVNAETRR